MKEIMNHFQKRRSGADKEGCNASWDVGCPSIDLVWVLKTRQVCLHQQSRTNYPENWHDSEWCAKSTKTPWKMRSVVCCAGAFMNCWSKWLDFLLQTLKPFVPTYVSNSKQVLDQVKRQDFSSNARLFITDTVSMYNNIDTDHAITVISDGSEIWTTRTYFQKDSPRMQSSLPW